MRPTLKDGLEAELGEAGGKGWGAFPVGLVEGIQPWRRAGMCAGDVAGVGSDIPKRLER